MEAVPDLRVFGGNSQERTVVAVFTGEELRVSALLDQRNTPGQHRQVHCLLVTAQDGTPPGKSSGPGSSLVLGLCQDTDRSPPLACSLSSVP